MVVKRQANYTLWRPQMPGWGFGDQSCHILDPSLQLTRQRIYGVKLPCNLLCQLSLIKTVVVGSPGNTKGDDQGV